MDPHEITEPWITGVDLVGTPANNRRFAVVKSLVPPKAPEPEGTDVKLPDLLKDLTASDLIEAVGRDALLKELGVEPAAAPPEGADPPAPDLSKMDDTTRAWFETMTKKVEAVSKAEADRVEADRTARLAVLRKSGYGPEVLPDDSPIVRIEAFEVAHGTAGRALQKSGLFGPISAAGDGTPPDIMDAVSKAVREILGREPMNEEEAAIVKAELYANTPGLFQEVAKAEAAAKQ